MRHFVNKFSILFLVFTILEQLIAATSTYAMIALSSEILKGGHDLVWGLCAFSRPGICTPDFQSEIYGKSGICNVSEISFSL